MRAGFPPEKLKPSFSVFIPFSTLSECPTLREKTVKAGTIARFSAIFQVDKIVIYNDGSEYLSDALLLKSILDYYITPQYLRRKLFPIRKELKYVGLLHPLQTPSHKERESVESLAVPSFREGVLVAKRKELFVDIGLDFLVPLKTTRKPKSRRILVELFKKGEKLFAKPVPRTAIPYYWAPSVSIERRSLKELLTEVLAKKCVIATSRLGTPITDPEALASLKSALAEEQLHILFGSPRRGLYEIAREQGFELDDYVAKTINFIPRQGVKTVRLEEALAATLSLLHFLRLWDKQYITFRKLSWEA